MNGLDAVSSGRRWLRPGRRRARNDRTFRGTRRKARLKHPTASSPPLPACARGHGSLLPPPRRPAYPVVAQALAPLTHPRGWMGEDRGGPDGPGPGERAAGAEALHHLEDAPVVKAAARLRYGSLYTGRYRRRSALGRGSSRWSAVPATSHGCISTTRRAPPSGHRTKGKGRVQHRRRRAKPRSASGTLSGRAPGQSRERLPRWLARLLAGEMAVMMMTEGRSFPALQGQTGTRLGAALPVGGRASRKSLREQGRGVRGAAAAAVRNRLPDSRQRERGGDAVQKPGCYQAFPAGPASAKAFLSAAVTRSRRPALGPRPTGGARRYWLQAAAHRPLRGPRAVHGRTGRLGIDGSLAAAERLTPLDRLSSYCGKCSGWASADRVGSGRSGGVPPARGARARRHAGRADPVRGRPTQARELSTVSDAFRKATSTTCGSCSPLTFSWSGWRRQGHQRSPGASSS
jgi:hypothetical protein